MERDSDHDDLVPPDEIVNAQNIGVGDFKALGDGMVNGLRARGLLHDQSIVLDIGCGLGRLARPLTAILAPTARYYGFDINPTCIDWCRQRYALFRNFHFDWIDLHSAFYNAQGKAQARDFRFPIRDNHADLAILMSVFTHMYFEDAAAYVREIARMLKPGGRCVITYFLIDEQIADHYAQRALKGEGVFPILNGYAADREKPESVVFLKEPMVLAMYAGAGLQVEHVGYGSWAAHQGRQTGEGFQDQIVAIKTA